MEYQGSGNIGRYDREILNTTVMFPETRDFSPDVVHNNYQNGLYKGQLIDKDGGTIETEIKKLMADDEVTSKKGIYKYILDGQEKHLSLRAFDKNTAKTMYAKQQGHCPYCDQKIEGHTYPQDQTSKLYGANTYEFDQMQADHIKPWSKGGKTVPNNCQMLCEWHNEHKSDE